MNFLKLTLDREDVEFIYLNPSHIVSLKDYEKHTYITTSSNNNYSVRETSHDIIAMVNTGTITPNKKTSNGIDLEESTLSKKSKN